MGYVPPIEHLVRQGRMGIDECREQWQRDHTAEPLSAWSPWMVTAVIASLAWASFCLGMWIGQTQTLALVNAVERIEAEQ